MNTMIIMMDEQPKEENTLLDRLNFYRLEIDNQFEKEKSLLAGEDCE